MFTYGNLLDEMQRFANYGIQTGVIGESTLHNPIPYVFVGNHNGNCLIVQGAMHAREHLTALVVVCLAKYLVANGNLQMDGGIYFVPMTNPDGARLCQEGVGFVRDKHQKSNLIAINGGTDFSLWKANAEGVDVNVNFDADWGKGTQNQFCKGKQNYVGKCPFSTKEATALAQFTKTVKPCATLSYHLKGEQIYWRFGQTGKALLRDYSLAQSIANYTGYTLVDGAGSVGGYKDWCIQKLGIPSFTVEVGNDDFDHPFPYSQLSTIVDQNKDLPRLLLNSVVNKNYSF